MNICHYLFLIFISYSVGERFNSYKDGYEPLKYNTFNEIELRLQEIASSLPGVTKLDTIGKTYEENDIWQITFSNRIPSITKNVVWIDCGMQARDWITHSTCMYIIDSISQHLLRENVNDYIDDLLSNHDVTILPIINPDGYIKTWGPYDRAWIKNMKPDDFCVGVFISQNFPFRFGTDYSNIYMKCDADYAGPSANSENETTAVMQSLESLSNSNGVFALFHMESSGQTWAYPWSYAMGASPVVQALEAFCEAGVSAIKSISSKDYTCGQHSDVNGTRGGTLIDYAHYELGINTVYTLALRSGSSDKYDVPEDQIEDTGKEILGGIMASLQSKSMNIDCVTNIFSEDEYMPFHEIEEHLFCVKSLLGSKVQLEGSDSKTFENNTIWQMTFSKDFAAMPAHDIVWIDCGMQGRDWISHATCIYIINAIAKHFLDEVDPLIDNLLDTFDLAVIPVVNPDGYLKSWTGNNRHWLKNTHDTGSICDGVYIGQNFPANFGSPYSNDEECDLDYIGPAEMSEFESVALSDNLNSLKRRLFMVFHLESNGQKWMYPWSYTFVSSQYADSLEKSCQSGVRAILLESGRRYTCSQMSVGEGTTRGGTFVDFVHSDIEIPLVYSIALRSGENVAYEVPTEEISANGREIWVGMLAAVDSALNDPWIPPETTTKPLPTTPGAPPDE